MLHVVQGVQCTKHFCAGCYVIFDGYNDGHGPSTKGVEQERRAMKVQSSDIHLAEDMPGRRNRSSRAFLQRTRLGVSVHWLIT